MNVSLTFCYRNNKNNPKKTISVASTDVKINHDSSFHGLLNDLVEQISILTRFDSSTTDKFNQEVLK